MATSNVGAMLCQFARSQPPEKVTNDDVSDASCKLQPGCTTAWHPGFNLIT